MKDGLTECSFCKRRVNEKDAAQVLAHRRACLAAGLEQTLGPSAYGHRDPSAPPIPYKTNRPKRRRKGKLNDGEWAPGYGPSRTD